jgi:electron transfer flavoprotein-quinone oxidoreductase
LTVTRLRDTLFHVEVMVESMGEHIHDCIVVGAGPAGSAAALEMARAGLDVVMLERGDQPGQKNVMSGVLFTEKLSELVPDYRQRAPLQRCITGGYAQHILGEDWALDLPCLRDYSLLHHDTPAFTVFRSEFDAWFAQEAQDAGVELFTATLVEDLLWEEGLVAGVHTRRGDLRARVVIGADGVNSTVAEKAGLMPKLQPDEVYLIARQVLDLPAEVIEERLTLGPGEGALSIFVGQVQGPAGRTGVYYSEIYSNRDSLSMTMDARLDDLVRVGLPVYEALEQWQRHPYIARLIQGATLREYQAHLIPSGGPPDLGCLYGDGVLLAGDAGKVNTRFGVGSWPAMASGAAAARTVQHALERGDFSSATLSVYRDFLAEEGIVEFLAEARRGWMEGRDLLFDMAANLEATRRVAARYAEDEGDPASRYDLPLWVEVYQELARSSTPPDLRPSLDEAASLATRHWRHLQDVQKQYKGW